MIMRLIEMLDDVFLDSGKHFKIGRKVIHEIASKLRYVLLNTRKTLWSILLFTVGKERLDHV